MLRVYFDFILILIDYNGVFILIFCFEYVMLGVDDIIGKE